MFPKPLNDLIESLTKITGVGEKTATRYAFEILNWNENEIQKLVESLVKTRTDIKKCENCGNFTENTLCEICVDVKRDNSQICIVETVRDLIAIEKTNIFNGKYKILEKLISIVDGIYPEDLNIEQFIKQCKENNVKEVIMALSMNIPGETTSLYISKKLEQENISVTRLASGIPMGSNIEYIDILTLSQALEGRKKID